MISPTTQDVYLVPDPGHHPPGALVPGAHRPGHLRRAVSRRLAGRNFLAPRAARGCSKLYAARGWVPDVAPELEFFLVGTNTDPDYPLEPPIGRSGRRETSRQAYGVDAVNEFDPLFEDVYDFCEAQGIDIDTLTHEAGAAQMEMNFNHGPPLAWPTRLSCSSGPCARRAAPPGLRDLHGQADAGRARQLHAHPPERDRQAKKRPQPLRPEERQGFDAVPQPYRGAAEIPAGGHAAAGAQRELLPPPGAGLFGRADQHPLGLRQPHRGPARAPFRRGRPAGREPPGRRRRQPLSGDRRPRWPAAIWA